MPDKVTLTRPDGSIFQTDAATAERLKQLGSPYQEETRDSMRARVREEGRDEYYSDQKLETFVEGAASGLTLGASDYLTEEVFGWDTSERAQYNPGTRIAGEIVGGIVPALVPGGGAAVLAKTPAGAVASLASRAGAAAGGSAAKRMAVSGAVEGAVLGATAANTSAYLSGDPLTAEAVIAGMGWGAVLGGGIGGLVGKVHSGADKIATRNAAEVARTTFPEVEYNAFRSSIVDARTTIADAVKTAESRVASANAAAVAPETIAADLAKAATARQELHRGIIDELTATGTIAKVKTVKDAMILDMKAATSAAAKGDVKAFEAAMESHALRMQRMQRAAGQEPMTLEAFAYKPAGQGSLKAVEELKDLALIRDTLKTFPATANGFGGMKEKKLEVQIQAIEKLMSSGGAELEGIRTAVKDSLKRTAEATGVMVDGSPGEQMRALWEIGKGTKKKATQEAVSMGAPGILKSAGRYTAGRGTVAATGATSGVGRVVSYGLGSAFFNTIVGLKGAVTGSLSDAVARWAPRVASGTKAVGKVNAAARVDPLRTRLDGSVDMEKKTRRQLMKERAEEFARNAPTVRNTLYRSLEGASVEHPAFVASMIDTADKQFQAMAARVPRDPGTMRSRMKSMWAPDDVSTEKFARAYEVFQNPVGVARRALETGEISVEAARALREVSPALFQELRVGMLEKLSDPANLAKLSYGEQVNLGRLLDITIHSTQTPRFIAAQQAMFQERNQPLTVRPPGGSTSNNPSGGRPPGASAASAITEH